MLKCISSEKLVTGWNWKPENGCNYQLGKFADTPIIYIYDYIWGVIAPVERLKLERWGLSSPFLFNALKTALFWLVK